MQVVGNVLVGFCFVSRNCTSSPDVYETLNFINNAIGVGINLVATNLLVHRYLLIKADAISPL
jgi:hypothetical protein